LTQGKFAIVDAADYDWLNQSKWCASWSGRTFYALRWVRTGIGTGKNIAMHRVILGIVDPLVQVDHEDGDGLHNWRRNIRRASNSQNQCNKGLQTNNKRG